MGFRVFPSSNNYTHSNSHLTFHPSQCARRQRKTKNTRFSNYTLYNNLDLVLFSSKTISHLFIYLFIYDFFFFREELRQMCVLCTVCVWRSFELASEGERKKNVKLLYSIFVTAFNNWRAVRESHIHYRPNVVFVNKKEMCARPGCKKTRL